MLISGIQKFTLIDFPGKTACVVFTPGCNFRCGFCHNAEFVLPEKIKQIEKSFISEEVFFNFIKKRKNLLDGVVITGGEPTIMPDLVDFIEKIKQFNLLVKLDTNGSNAGILKELINKNLLDYIAMDIKTSLENYPKLVGAGVKMEDVEENIKFIIQSKVPYEFRSTILKEIHPPEVLEKMAELVKGANKLFLQTFRPQNTLDPIFGKYNSFSKKEMKRIAEEVFSPYVKKVETRE